MRVGMVGRFFALNWRPPLDEIRFAAEHGFAAIQIRSDRAGQIGEELRADLGEVGAAFAAAGIEPVLEMLVRHEGVPETMQRALRANLAAIAALGTRRVHIHPIGRPEAESLLLDELGEALEVAKREGLTLGVEHNAAAQRFFTTPAAVRRLLDALPELHLVWDINHTHPDDLDAFVALTPRLSLVHVSDTVLPGTNQHLPLGRGTVDFSVLRGIEVPLILEIGGLPASGGYGLDTDEALLDSLERLRVAVG
jgi:L-ribulose-5-phosphate 3-epimerase